MLDRGFALADRAPRRGDRGIEPLATRVVVADPAVPVGVPDDLLHPEVGELVLDADPGVPIRPPQPALYDLSQRGRVGALDARVLEGIAGRVSEFPVARGEGTDDDRALILGPRHGPASVRSCLQVVNTFGRTTSRGVRHLRPGTLPITSAQDRPATDPQSDTQLTSDGG